MRGAVDLSALRDRAAAGRPTEGAPAGPPASPATPPAPTGGVVTVIDVTEATFQTEVLERSLTTPVVIDFWAEWCGPCKQLSPVLERLAVEGGGAWVLAKIDVDANPRIAQTFRVQGIPMVFAVVGGQPVDAFTGVIPEAQLRRGSTRCCRPAGSRSRCRRTRPLVAADDALMTGDLDEAERAYKKILAERPADEVAEAGLAQVGLFRRVAGRRPGRGARGRRGRARRRRRADASPPTSRCSAARPSRPTRAWSSWSAGPPARSGTGSATHLVSLFAVAAPDDPAVLAARRALANALF